MKFWLYFVLYAAVAAAGWYVYSTFTERDELKAANKLLEAEVDYVKADRDLARMETINAVAKMQKEIELNAKLAKDEAARRLKIQEDLDRANFELHEWANKDLQVAACLSRPMPDGMFPRPVSGPTTEIADYACPATVESDGTDSGACIGRSLGGGLLLGQRMQSALRTCNSRLEALREWRAAHEEPSPQ